MLILVLAFAVLSGFDIGDQRFKLPWRDPVTEKAVEKIHQLDFRSALFRRLIFDRREV